MPSEESGWPFRQADPAWCDERMWDRSKVIQVHHLYNGAPLREAKQLTDDDTIGTQGCLLTCLAMTLRLLDPGGKNWTPGTLNKEAKARLFYSDALLSNVALYLDLVADVSNGRCQVCMQEQYLAGEDVLPQKYASKCSILRGYRRLQPAQRRHFVIMLKIGTHDDTFASHYVLVHPGSPGALDDDDVPLLDPDEPATPRVRLWRLSDSYSRLRQNQKIAKAWRKCGIRTLQLSGVWAFARWPRARARSLAGNLLAAAARQSR